MASILKRHLKPALAAASIMAIAAAGYLIPFEPDTQGAGLKAALIVAASLAAGYLASVATRD